MAFVFAALAGESVKSTMHKIQAANDHSHLVQELEDVQIGDSDIIDIETSSPDVKIVSESGNAMKVEFAGTVRVENGEKVLEIKRHGRTLHVGLKPNLKSTFHFDFFNGTANLENLNISSFMGIKISIPKTFNKALRVTTSSGDIKLKDLQLAALEATASSGNITTQSCQAQDTKLQTSSGDIQLDSIAGDVEAQASSGEIVVDQPEALKIAGSSNSGDIRVRLGNGNDWRFKLHASSGDIRNTFSENPNGKKSLELNTSSGNIEVTR